MEQLTGLGSTLGSLILYLCLQLYSGLHLLEMHVIFLWLLLARNNTDLLAYSFKVRGLMSSAM